MKKFLLSCLAFFVLGAAALAQNNVVLHLSPRLGNAPFALNTPVSAGAYEYKINRLEYYISEIKITHDGGQETPVTDMHLLVRPALDSMYYLGSFPQITNVESITFSVGVDQAHNHLDPASYPANHPLAPQNPAMQWGWAAGYRFVAIEGKAGVNFAYDFEIHALGDANYKTLTLPTAAETHPDGDKTIHLVADYSQVLSSINVSAGLIVHGSSGKAVTVMNNMKDVVFSAETSAVLNPAFEGTFSVSPNPATAGKAVATMTLPEGGDYRISLTDLSGRVVINQPIAAGSQTFAIDQPLNAGVYFVQLWQNARPVAVEKLIVTQ
ncbi:MAG: T9SS type A sorting domain-containing protein [Saprospiraceae bacterium]|nr:T9SS type A sorting domain-containing protein [Saprospiraceae bacterium]